MNSDSMPLPKLQAHVERERQWRLLMDADENADDASVFLSQVEGLLPYGTPVPTLITNALVFASGISYQHGTVPPRVYLKHPLRVAGILVREMKTIDEVLIAIALLHNVLEVSDVSLQQLSDLLGVRAADAIGTLTVDRTRQHDRIYKNEYYAAIEEHSSICAQVKVADKLDNIYMLCFNPSEAIRDAYLDEIDRWVVPMAKRVIPVLGARIAEASAVMRTTGFLDKASALEQARRVTA